MIPILTYHSAYISGDSYPTNDHVAFASDLRLVHRLGRRIVPLDAIVTRLAKGESDFADCVAFTMDDGTNFDFYDLPHPTWGMQRSMLNIMKDFVAEFGAEAQPELHATSFVIVSPNARDELDRTCLISRQWYTDEWWNQAIASGMMGIANHSWDHNHDSLAVVTQRDQHKGTFLNIDTYADADEQIRQASAYLNMKTDGKASRLFAYPYGEVNDYLALSYLPDFATEHKLTAAFATGPEHIGSTNGVWTIPRLVFRDHWHSQEQLEAILRSSKTH